MNPKNKTLLICLIFFCFTFTAQVQEAKENVKVTTVAYCDLIKFPTAYDNKIICVKAEYMAAFEASFMSTKNCEAKPTWVRFDSSIEDSTDKQIWKRFLQLIDTTPLETKDRIKYISRYVEVVWIGLFQGLKQIEYKDKSETFYLGFGHMNR